MGSVKNETASPRPRAAPLRARRPPPLLCLGPGPPRVGYPTPTLHPARLPASEHTAGLPYTAVYRPTPNPPPLLPLLAMPVTYPTPAREIPRPLFLLTPSPPLQPCQWPTLYRIPFPPPPLPTPPSLRTARVTYPTPGFQHTYTPSDHPLSLTYARSALVPYWLP